MNLNQAKIIIRLLESSNNFKYEIENPKGSIKVFVEPGEKSNYPLKQVKYPVDYGYIDGGYIAQDEAELDIFIGTGDMYGYMNVYREDIDGNIETKMIYKVTSEEYDSIIKVFKPVVRKSVKFKNENEFMNFIKKFK